MTAHGVEDVLRGLLGGMPLEDFNDQVRERRVAHFKAAIEPTLLESSLQCAPTRASATP